MKIKTARKKFIKSKIEKCPIDLILVAMENILEKLQLLVHHKFNNIILEVKIYPEVDSEKTNSTN